MKRIVGLLIVFVLSLALVGCSSREDIEKHDVTNLNNDKEKLINSIPTVSDSKDLAMDEKNKMENNHICDEPENEIMNLQYVEKVIIYFNIYSSIQLIITEDLDLEILVNILNSDKKQVLENIDIPLEDVHYFIDIIYKDKTTSIKVLFKNDDYYYIINNNLYSWSKVNYSLLSEFVIQRYLEYLPKYELDYIKK